MVLSRHGYTVLLAPTIGAARSIWANSAGELDLVITDNSLPDGSGVDLVKEMRAEKGALKVVVSSGANDLILPPDYRILPKPFDVASLLAAVRAEIG